MTRWIAWSVWGATMLLLLALVPLSTVDPSAFSGPGSVAVGLAVLLFILVFATVGLVVALRRPRNAIGWTLGFGGIVYAVASASNAYANWAFLVRHGDLPGAATAAWLTEWVWNLAIGPAVILPLLLFPDGALPSRRWRPALWVALAAVAVTSATGALVPGRFADYPIDNPVGIDGAKPVLEFLLAAGTVALLAVFVAVVVSLVRRFRKARGTERQQLKWLTYSAGVIAVAGIAAGFLVEPVSTDTSNAIESLSFTTYPVALGVAMLRYRLYDIDVVINRTLVYGLLTATLAGAYLGSVLLLQLALDRVTSGSSLAVAVSTLGVAALFRPARARIQGAVDRRFYRRKYDAARTLEEFSARLREQVDLEALGGELRTVVADTMQPAHVSLWLREAGR
jgi:hypothetical protein